MAPSKGAKIGPIYMFQHCPWMPKAVLAITIALFSQVSFAQDAPPPAVVSALAEERDLDITVTYNGRLDADSRVSLVAQVSGTLQEVLFEPGDRVDAGQLLFRIDPSLFAAAVAEASGALQSAEAARDVAQLERDRQAELVARDTVAQAVLDNVEAELAAREGDVVRLSAALDRAEINLSYTEIAAPFDGIIGPAAFDAGAFINPQSGALAAMTKLDPIHAEFQVPTASLRDYLENVDAGTASNIAAVTLRLANGTVYDTPGDVDFVDTTVTTGTDSVQMRARFDNPDGRLLDQELVEVTLTAQAGTPELAIPQQAVQRDVQGAFVLVVGEGSVAEQRRVEVGRTSQGFAVITSGLAPGEEVITDGVNKVRLGAPVDAAPAESN